MNPLDELPRRNGEAVLQTLARMEKQVFDQDAKLAGFNSTITTLTNRVTELEQTIARQRAAAMGHGATVK